ncbi:flagellar type III secretion system protein FlhB [Bacillus cereus]|uniref:Flagellar biosynthesis protein FlhB n=1 Tax=Bacillus cereus TaxID=1396 RepID=A0A161R745_BACCE|nr:EscU/YscU/HrcU family type III secretion system export apparatus switch protein [Bacillus cereus]KZD72071.1 Flagellar biosynthesis protein FlhB [Bacillus cereus]
MAKQAGATEKATPQRRQEARKKGNVAKSKSLTLFFQLFSLYLFVKVGGVWFAERMVATQNLYFELTLSGASWDKVVIETIMHLTKTMFPIFLLLTGAVLIDYLIQVRFVFAIGALKPDWNRLNPVNNYFKKVFSRSSLIELLKSIFIFIMLGLVMYFSFKNEVNIFLHALRLPWDEALVRLIGVFEGVLLKIILGFLVVAIADFVYQRWEYEENIKMKKEDVKREHKNNDGSPEMKSFQRQKMQDLIKVDVVEKVPNATFVAVNPTHYAIAVKWNPGEGNPFVLVKGIDQLALFIREIAETNNIPIVQNPAFARELYQRVSDQEEIPEDMWKILSQILHQLIAEGQLEIPN